MTEEKNQKEIHEELLWNEFEIFFDKWIKNKELSTRDIVYMILSKIKCEYCLEHECLFHLIGELNYMLHDNLEEMFYDIRNSLNDIEEK